MKRLRFKLFLLTAVAAVAAGVWTVAQVQPSPQPLSRWMPGGALFYLESADFATQLQDWDRSEVKTRWLASKNHEQFLTTRLALKLTDAYGEFAAAAGFPPDLTALETFAGTDTALAVYDIGKLDLIYISRLPAAQLAQNALTRVRPGYQARTVAGQSYFVRQSGSRTAAFAINGDYVIVSTREDLLSEALELIQGNTTTGSISNETWYQDAVRAMGPDAGNRVALRLVMDLPTVIKTPYFRSYWIQRNTADLRPYSALLSQLTRQNGVLQEDRVLVRAAAASAASHDAATIELQRFMPGNAGLIRLWDTTSTDFAMDLIREKFFAAGPRQADERRFAPAISPDASANSEGDFQTRIDQAPKPSLAGALTLQPMRALVESGGIQAVLQLESSLPADDTTFVRTDAVLALRASKSWNPADVRSALTAAAASYQTVNNIGLQWRNVTSGSRMLSQWDGLIPLTIYVDGQTLWIGRTAGLLGSALNTPANTGNQAATYLARYTHSAELAPYLKMMRMLDLSDQANYSAFFSDNIGSLASTLDVIQSVSIKISDSGPVQRQAIRYDLAR
ncbi:MAG TPA: hypothetical protein VGK48_11335 [Terriglobia bacterium]|jgi:hypothetical protein